MKAGIAVVFLEYGERDAPTGDIYTCLRWIARAITQHARVSSASPRAARRMTGPDLKKLNASDYAAVRNNTIVVAPNNQAIGFANAGMLCTQVC